MIKIYTLGEKAPPHEDEGSVWTCGKMIICDHSSEWELLTELIKAGVGELGESENTKHILNQLELHK